MLAGPKNFPFGTTVEIPGLGIGGIYDRGSAIISTGSHDVIDVWAGYGLQGLVNVKCLQELSALKDSISLNKVLIEVSTLLGIRQVKPYCGH